MVRRQFAAFVTAIALAGAVLMPAAIPTVVAQSGPRFGTAEIHVMSCRVATGADSWIGEVSDTPVGFDQCFPADIASGEWGLRINGTRPEEFASNTATWFALDPGAHLITTGRGEELLFLMDGGTAEFVVYYGPQRVGTPQDPPVTELPNTGARLAQPAEKGAWANAQEERFLSVSRFVPDTHDAAATVTSPNLAPMIWLIDPTLRDAIGAELPAKDLPQIAGAEHLRGFTVTLKGKPATLYAFSHGGWVWFALVYQVDEHDLTAFLGTAITADTVPVAGPKDYAVLD